MVLVMITIACRAFTYVGRFLYPTINLGIFPKFIQKTIFFSGNHFRGNWSQCGREIAVII